MEGAVAAIDTWVSPTRVTRVVPAAPAAGGERERLAVRHGHRGQRAVDLLERRLLGAAWAAVTRDRKVMITESDGLPVRPRVRAGGRPRGVGDAGCPDRPTERRLDLGRGHQRRRRRALVPRGAGWWWRRCRRVEHAARVSGSAVSDDRPGEWGE